MNVCVCVCVYILTYILSVSSNHLHSLIDFRDIFQPLHPLPHPYPNSLSPFIYFPCFNFDHQNLFSEFLILALNQYTELTYFSLWKPGFIYVST